MNTSKFPFPMAVTIAFARIIGIAYAQTGTTGTPNNRSSAARGEIRTAGVWLL